jgi:quinoprotein glucose dehydrogenase
MKERVANARNEGLFTPPALVDTISMPGNQGGANWGTTAANPQKGLVFVVNVNQVAILRLEDVRTRTVPAGRGGGTPLQAGFAAYQQHCSSCHGANLQGVVPGAASLVAVTDRMGEDAIKAIVTGGRGLMRPVPGVTDVELNALVAYLASSSPTRPGGRGRGGPPPVFPPGPVVARGGAPPPAAPPRTLGPFYPGLGGNAGNYPYPEDVGGVPPTRYMSDYGVFASWTRPPYTTITAYDLNTGGIKWQVPNGDHAPTIAAGGPANTGGLGARNGMVVTKGGLVFHAGGDGKFRAYDQDSGKVLWSAPFVGNAPGVPVSYESRGRQYVAMIASHGGGGAPGTDTQPASGMVAYVLKRR